MENILHHVYLEKDVKLAKKAIKHFWKLNKQLDHIFGIGIVVAIVSQYMGIVMCLYHLVLKADNDQDLEVGTAYTLFFLAFVIRRMSFSAQRCIDCAKRFTTLGRSVDSSAGMEGFYLQLRHQNIKFSALSFLDLTNEYVTKVSGKIEMKSNHGFNDKSYADDMLGTLVLTDCFAIPLSLWNTLSFLIMR